jgi:hypothetical protein
MYLSTSNCACLTNERIHAPFIVIYSRGQNGEDKVVVLRQHNKYKKELRMGYQMLNCDI